MGFRSARESAKLTQVEVAKAMGVDQSAVSQWETGIMFPRGSRLIELANLYGVTVDELLKEEK